MSDSIRKPKIALGLVGAFVGGIVGYFAFQWIYRQGFYALVVPPSLLGLAAGYCVRGRSVPFAIGCGIAGLALGLFTEWSFRPFVADSSIGYFMTHIHTLKPFSLLSLVVGTFFSYRFALGMDRKSTAA